MDNNKINVMKFLYYDMEFMRGFFAELDQCTNFFMLNISMLALY